MADVVDISNPKALGELIEKAMQDYVDQVDEILETCMEEIGKEAVKKLKKTGPSKTGKYRRAWRVEWKKSRIGVIEGQIFNSKRGQLTHLLEYGHPIVRNGVVVGNAKAQPHIAPVEQWVNEELPRRFEQKLNSL